MSAGRPAVEGVLVVDKAQGWTSHDVVARTRRLAGTRKVGHAGTLDPMATGVLVLGIGRATRLLGHLALTDKEYAATVRLGVATTTDDAEGEPTGSAGAAGVTEQQVRSAMVELTGDIQQVPSSVSAIKVDGKRAYALVRGGSEVALAARPVTVSAFDLLSTEEGTAAVAGQAVPVLDVEVRVTCSSGTYVRALARDLGRALGTGGHLTALRRTRVGPFGLDSARTLDELAGDVLAADGELPVVPLAVAVDRGFPRLDVDAEAAVRVRQTGRLPLIGDPRVHGVFGPDGECLALVQDDSDRARSLVVFAGLG